ncbi:MAG: hypothetical protein PF549_02985, partial [Patescibacteria group bacterium]|nr:hypothetical protein [Patescibacteria group bacterium]
GIPRQYAGDIWLLIIFLAIGIALIFLIKKKNLGSLLISVYVAYVVSLFSFFLPKDVNFRAIYFLFLVAGVFWMMKKIFGINFHGKKIVIWFQILVMALAIVGLSLSLVLTWISPKELGEFFTPFSRQLFVSDLAKFLWVLVPFIALVLIKKRKY